MTIRQLSVEDVVLDDDPSFAARVLDHATRAPLPCAPGTDLEVHAMIGRDYVLPWLCAIKTFLSFSELACHVVVHSDGSLGPHDQELLETQVPGCEVLELDVARCRRENAGRPYSCRFAADNVFGRRLFGILNAAETERVLILDSDVLFFRRPSQIVEWSNGASSTTYYNGDSGYDDSILFDERDFEVFGSRKIYSFNAGLVCTSRRLFDADLIEAALERLYASYDDRHAWVFDQSVLALLVSRGPSAVLPATYDFDNEFTDKEHPPLNELTSKHYSGSDKRRFFGEGVRYLIETGRF